MEKTLDNKLLKDKIEQFCRKKNFEKPFIKECITEFVEKHTKLYGDVVTSDDLFKRLDENLDKITFAGPNFVLGEYKGRIADNTDINEIYVYSNESDLEPSENDKKMWNIYTESDKQKLLQSVQKTKDSVKSTVLHELTHCAYTIKDKYGLGEKHIFSQSYKEPTSRQYRQFGTSNVEAIVNYISNRIEGKGPDDISTYPAETKAIFMLSKKIDEKKIIKSAWASDEKEFKENYIQSVEKNTQNGEISYDNFQKGMKQLVAIREQHNNGNMDYSEFVKQNNEKLSKIQQILNGNTYNLDFSTFKNLQKSPHTIVNIPTEEHDKKAIISFSQKVASFIKNRPSLMNIPIFKNFARKHLDALPPAQNKEDGTFIPTNNKKQAFINELTSNVKEIPSPITSKENLNNQEINKQVEQER